MYQSPPPAIIDAIDNHDVASLKALLEHDPGDQSEALLYAVQYHEYECSKILLPLSKQKDYHMSCFIIAVSYKDQKIIDLMYPVVDTKMALKRLKKFHGENVWGELDQRIKADEEQQILTNEIGSCGVAKERRKI